MKRILRGKSVSASDLKKLHESSYKDVKDDKIGDWELDKEISKFVYEFKNSMNWILLLGYRILKFGLMNFKILIIDFKK